MFTYDEDEVKDYRSIKSVLTHRSQFNEKKKKFFNSLVSHCAKENPAIQKILEESEREKKIKAVKEGTFKQ